MPTCENCGAKVTDGLYDDHAEIHFCDEQCFREWAADKGEDKVLTFYKNLNISEGY